MPVNTVEDSTRELVDRFINAQLLEEAFCGFIVHSPDNAARKKGSCTDMIVKYWQSLPEESHVQASQCYVSEVYSQASPKRAQFLLDMLEALVENNGSVAKVICEALISSDKLTHKNSVKWCQSFRLIRRIIGGVFYKGTRDLFRAILEKCQSVDFTQNVASTECLDVVYDVVSYIIDRNTCLLPSYFAVNEIVKFCNLEHKPWPHWRLGELLAEFVQSFRPTAQMVTVMGRSSLLPVVGHASTSGNVWKLNPTTLRFTTSGPLPYDKELEEPQIGLLRYVLEQPYSRDMVCNILSLNKQVKQRCHVLEEHLIELVLLAMERSETEDDPSNGGDGINQLLWQHLSSQLIFFVLFQFASFPHMVLALYDKLKGRNLWRGRDHLMWVLLQFISGSIQKNPLEDFLPVMKLYDLLYPEKEGLPLPDVNSPTATHKMAVTCIWIHLDKKAQSDKVRLQRPIPNALQGHIEYLKQASNVRQLSMNDYKIALLCNAYSTNQEYFMMPMTYLVESIYGNQQKTTTLPGNVTAAAPTTPLPMKMLDCLTVHAKMSLIHSIGTKVIKLAQTKSNVALAPALVETYSRLLVYIEIESLGIKGFISQLLPSVFKSSAWGILHTLLEMFSYRLHHIQPHYRVQLLGHLHSLAKFDVPYNTNQNQLHLCVESTALRLVMGLGSWEVHPQLSRMFNETNRNMLISSDSEELNRALVLTLARAMHVTGPETLSSKWCTEILTQIMQQTPHSWSPHTLQNFPQPFIDFFQQNPIAKEDKPLLKRNVENEYRKWKSMMSENDLINHFSGQSTSHQAPQQPIFLCILWKSLMEDARISPTAYKVLEKIGPRKLSSHLRTFADYLIYEFVNSQGNAHVNKCVDSLNDLIWKCNVVPIDRLVLILSLRCLEGNEAQVCYFIIQIILLKPQEFKSRVQEFVRDNSPEHWIQNNWHVKHMTFHTKYPEKFYFEGLQDIQSQQQQQYHPIYFSNVCLRFLPVLDIVIHRFLDNQAVTKSLESILDHLGMLYKFHDRPVTYMYNTLHYYEKKLRDRPALKKKLVGAIIGSLKEIKPKNWCLSEEYQEYLNSTMDEASFSHSPEYYTKLVERMVNTISGKSPAPFPTCECDWRFNEFPNPTAHALHATCVELMALPVTGQTVGHKLMDIVLKGNNQIKRDEILSWMNAVGLILTALPESYWTVLHEKIVETLQTLGVGTSLQLNSNIFQALNFSSTHQVVSELTCSYVLVLSHAIWQHASIGQLTLIPQFLREQVKPLVKSEEQFVFVCHLVGPFLQRFHAERTRCLLDMTIELYEMLESVDKTVEHLYHINPITDFLYHIKYMFVGDGVKAEVDKVIRNLRPALQLRLRYISHAHAGKEDVTPQPHVQ